MAIRDLVMFPPAQGGLMGDQETDIGIVIAEDVGPPATADVMWQSTGKVSLAVPQAELRKVTPGPLYNSGRIGCWVQIRSYPAIDEGTPQSPASSGLLLDNFMLGPYDDDPDETVCYYRVSVQNGMQTILLAEDPGDGQLSLVPPADSLITNKVGQRNS